jgi:hypothetical protein
MSRSPFGDEQISIWRSAVAKPCQVLAVSLLCNGR